VVVGTQFEQVNLLGFTGAHREHDDRHARPGADALDYIGAVHVREAEVDDHEIDRTQRCRADGFGAGAGFVHDETIEFKTGAKKPADLNLVVNDENDWRWLTHRSRFQVAVRRFELRAVRSPPWYR